MSGHREAAEQLLTELREDGGSQIDALRAVAHAILAHDDRDSMVLSRGVRPVSEQQKSVPDGVKFLADDGSHSPTGVGVTAVNVRVVDGDDVIPEAHGSPSLDGPGVPAPVLTTESSVGAVSGASPSGTPDTNPGGVA